MSDGIDGDIIADHSKPSWLDRQPACHRSLTAECRCLDTCCYCYGPEAPRCAPHPCTC